MQPVPAVFFEVLSLAAYDERCRSQWYHRIPDVSSPDLSKRLGDCIYDYSRGKSIQRPGVHGPLNIDTDLSGLNVLVSEHFYYFGSRAIKLPAHLGDICHRTQGHRSSANDGFFADFVKWIDRGRYKIGQLYGWPDWIIEWEATNNYGGCELRLDDDQCI